MPAKFRENVLKCSIECAHPFPCFKATHAIRVLLNVHPVIYDNILLASFRVTPTDLRETSVDLL